MSETGDGFQSSPSFNQNRYPDFGHMPRAPATKSEIVIDQGEPSPKNFSRQIPIQPVPPMMSQSATMMQPNNGFYNQCINGAILKNMSKKEREVSNQNGYKPPQVPVRPMLRPMMVPRPPPLPPMRMMQPAVFPFRPIRRPMMVRPVPPRPALVAPYPWRPGFMPPPQPGFMSPYPYQPNMLLAIEPPQNFATTIKRGHQVNITEIIEPPEQPEPLVPILKLIEDKVTQTDVTKSPTYPLYLSSYIPSPISSQRLAKNKNLHLLDETCNQTLKDNLNRSRENILDRTPLLVVSQSAKEVMARNEEILAQAEREERSKPVSYMINANASENGDDNGSVELEMRNFDTVTVTPKPTRRIEMDYFAEQQNINARRAVQPQLVTKDWPKETNIDDVVGNQGRFIMGVSNISSVIKHFITFYTKLHLRFFL